MFLSPTDALHGDIGCVARGDVVVALSKSGGSEELLKLLPFAKVVPPHAGTLPHAAGRSSFSKQPPRSCPQLA